MLVLAYSAVFALLLLQQPNTAPPDFVRLPQLPPSLLFNSVKPIELINAQVVAAPPRCSVRIPRMPIPAGVAFQIQQLKPPSSESPMPLAQVPAPECDEPAKP